MTQALSHALTPAMTTDAIIDDSTALQRFAATGDPRAFETLVHRYQAMVLATCKRTLRNDSDAEDATQEAFLRLAQHAGAISSNAAAWLHACAMRASLDLLRKKGSVARAEQKAGEFVRAAGESGADDQVAQAEWHEIEPMLDEALAKLSEQDRDLIVGRFLAGRSQKEMAQEAGVNPGTMHRRIEKSLDRLRRHLNATGLSVAGTLGAALLLGAGSTGGVSASLTGSLVKIGLVGLTRRPPGGLLAGGLLGSVAGKAAVITAAALIGLMAVGGAVMMRADGSFGMGRVPPVGRGVERATVASSRLMMTSNLAAGVPNGAMRCTGDTIVFEGNEFSDEDQSSELVRTVFKILDSRTVRGVDTLTLTVGSTNLYAGHPIEQMIGKPFEATYKLDGNRVTLNAELSDDGGTDDMTWHGSRPPPGDQNAVGAIEDAPLAPGLGGLWYQVEPYTLQLSEKDITVRWEDYTVHRYRILNWSEAKHQTRVQAICADSMNPGMVGDRVKILLREDEAGFTMAMHNQYSDKLNEWPQGFDVAPEVTVMTFRKGTP